MLLNASANAGQRFREIDFGELHSVDSADVKGYLQEMTGEFFTAKDSRTWSGTVQTALALAAIGAASTQTKAPARRKRR